MAEAFEILEKDSENQTSLSGEWPLALVKSAVHFHSLVFSTEKKLSELLSNPAERFYYFPPQKLMSASKLICEICNAYGFLSEIVDSNRPDKANVIVRRSPVKVPSMPKVLLRLNISLTISSLLDNVDELASEEIETETTDLSKSQEAEELILLEPFKPNSIFVQKIPKDVALNDILKSLSVVYRVFNITGSLYWISDSDFFCVFQSEEVVDIEKLREAFEDTFKGHAILSTQIIKNSYLRTGSDSILNVKKRSVPAYRWCVNDDGWVSTTKFRNQGMQIPLDEV